jgi:hypothetical protein
MAVLVFAGLCVAYMIGLVDGYRGRERKFGQKKEKK